MQGHPLPDKKHTEEVTERYFHTGGNKRHLVLLLFHNLPMSVLLEGCGRLLILLRFTSSSADEEATGHCPSKTTGSFCIIHLFRKFSLVSFQQQRLPFADLF